MQFSSPRCWLIIKNADKLSEYDYAVFEFVVPAAEEMPKDPPRANMIYVLYIELLDNGWVKVRPWDKEPAQYFPPWRVITLEDPAQ